jgi:hypothetical protein
VQFLQAAHVIDYFLTPAVAAHSAIISVSSLSSSLEKLGASMPIVLTVEPSLIPLVGEGGGGGVTPMGGPNNGCYIGSISPQEAASLLPALSFISSQSSLMLQYHYIYSILM